MVTRTTLFFVVVSLLTIMVVRQHIDTEAQKYGQFLLDHRCSRADQWRSLEPMYRCDGGYWTQGDIEKMMR